MIKKSKNREKKAKILGKKQRKDDKIFLAKIPRS